MTVIQDIYYINETYGGNMIAPEKQIKSCMTSYMIHLRMATRDSIICDNLLSADDLKQSELLSDYPKKSDL